MQTLIDDYVSAIRRIYGNHVRKVILYGSYAGDYTEGSDVDRKQKLRPAKEWIIPANPKYYDIEHAFDDTDEINWKQRNGKRCVSGED